MSLIDESAVKLGEGAVLDHNVQLGYLSGRNIKHIPAVIGKNAVIRSGSIIYDSTTIGDNLETGHYVIIREENKIGNNFNIWNHSVVDYGCTIGNNVKIHNHVYIPQFTTIEDDVFIAPGVTIANDPHPGCPKFRDCMRGPTIKKGAKIGAGVIILPWIVIGENALIGAGSVVTKDIAPGTVAYGNPAAKKKTAKELVCPINLIEGPYR